MSCLLISSQQTTNIRQFGWHGQTCLSVPRPCAGSGCKIEPAVRVQSGTIEPNGFTLIELIIFLVLAGIILPLIFIPFATGLKDYATPEIVSRATFLGEELMEEIKSKRFDENPASPTAPGNLGPDGGDRDDVDDYIGSQPPAAPFGDYSRSVTVFYVDASNLDVNANAIRNYKRIQVTVTNAQIPNVVLATLVSN